MLRAEPPLGWTVAVLIRRVSLTTLSTFVTMAVASAAVAGSASLNPRHRSRQSPVSPRTPVLGTVGG